MKPKVQPFFDARGRLLVERRGLPRATGARLASDAYHLMRTASWGRLLVFFFGLFAGMNAIFALILWLGNAGILNAHGFLDYFWFSVQTMGTIGYGYLAPDDNFANFIVTFETFTGIIFSAMATGVFFARFATPSARVIFSKVAVIAEQEGKRTLMFRMANARSTAIVEATCRVYLNRDERLASGEGVRRIYDLSLRRATSPVFALSWTAYHIIDETSPLFGLSHEQLRAQNTGIIVTFQGIDERLAANVHTRYAYDMTDIEFDRRFVDIFANDPETNVRFLDFGRFDETEPA